MSGQGLVDFTSGAIAMGYLVVSLWFFCSWRRSRVSLIGLFGVAFLLLAIERVALVLAGASNEFSSFFYLIRLVAFLIIIASIVMHNRRSR